MLNSIRNTLATSLVIVTQIALAQAPPAVDLLAIDEAGHIALNGLGVAIMGQRQPDPGPGGLSAALTFTLVLPLGPVLSQAELGDVLVFGTDGALASMLRFNPGFEMAFYSDIDAIGPQELADTGLPVSLYANQARIAEGARYIPGPGQPGYAFNLVSGHSLAYFIYGEVSAVPEPGSLPLLGGGLAGLVGWLARRRLRGLPEGIGEGRSIDHTSTTTHCPLRVLTRNCK